MATPIKIPELGESITEVQIARWLKQEGDRVGKDEDLVSIDSEKATVEIPSPASGTLTKILKPDGEDAKVGDVIGEIGQDGEAPSREKEAKATESQSAKASAKPAGQERGRKPERGKEAAEGSSRPAQEKKTKDGRESTDAKIMPAARALLEQHDLEAGDIEATGPGGRLLKEDVQAHLDAGTTRTPAPEREAGRRKPAAGESRSTPGPAPSSAAGSDEREEEVIRMTPLRRTVARRLVEAQRDMALLTTFNEVDLSAMSALRRDFRDAFQDRHGVKLGIMSFFVKAAIAALKEAPRLNGEIRGDDIVLHHYFDIGVAIGSGKGLVVPVIRNAGRLSFAEIEKAIADFASRAGENKLKPDELEGGTFTISNGGVYGSMLSTPIVNPPQSGILGLHAIQDRPVARGGEVVIRPMMYVALSYDHRIVDGREAVTFLRRVKEFIEGPSRLLLDV